MPSINLDLDYFDHPKVRRLVGLLGRGADVLPIRLWCYCGKYHAKSGELTGYSAQEIESILRWWGKPGELIDAMLAVNLIEKTENEPSNFFVHEWREHEGHLISFSIRGKKAIEARWKKLKYLKYTTSNTCEKLSNTPTKLTKPYLQSITYKTEKAAFEFLWARYPKRDGLKAAYRSFCASVTHPQDWEDINRALENYLKSDTVAKGYVKNGSTWFNNWRDWINYTEVAPITKEEATKERIRR